MTNPQIKVGTYLLGCQNVDLYALPKEGGGCYYTAPDESSPARIKVGLDYDNWWEVVKVLLHETFEFSADNLRGKLRPSGTIDNASDNCFFFLSHNAMSDVCASMASFITPALPALSKIYTQHRHARNKPPRKKTKPRRH